ncbi:unnamed protein product [Phytophthora lilii]|uniref:Unnamed protein product n=1 Tax=Phytophthora lilii TaxID=2077276 RepID=A0A9W6TPV4_9STRA|nr:unnamed protein product [Phytophthora lilii]
MYDVLTSAFRFNQNSTKCSPRLGLTYCPVGHCAEKQTIGKSRVIGALQGLARMWKSSETILTAAYQGVAAQAANRQSIHKLLGWYVNSRKICGSHTRDNFEATLPDDIFD